MHVKWKICLVSEGEQSAEAQGNQSTYSTPKIIHMYLNILKFDLLNQQVALQHLG